jgi:hypothetical protein
LWTVGACALLLASCARDSGNPAVVAASATPPSPASPVSQACAGIAGALDPVTLSSGVAAPVAVTRSVFHAATAPTATSVALPDHCEIWGTINPRTSSVDGRAYAIQFHMRLPRQEEWNGRFLMSGGGGTNGILGDALGGLPGAPQPDNALARGFAVISTDSGHDNVANDDPQAGGTASFARDPQARQDFYYGAYDVVTQVGKRLVGRYYGRAPSKSYFVGCSEGGREAMLMTQRFPTDYDGVVAGAPLLRGGTQNNSPQSDQRLAALARQMGLRDGNGLPALNKTYTDADMQLVAGAVLAACDATDGLKDGMVLNPTACTPARVLPHIDALACKGAKDAQCLSRAQVGALKDVMRGQSNARGQLLYRAWRWDPGMGGVADGKLNPGWRSWFLGTYAAPNNDAVKLALSAGTLGMASVTPPANFASKDAARYMLDFDYRALSTDPAVNFPAAGIYTDSPGKVYRADSTDLASFKARGGKLIVYHGMADPAIAFDDTATYFTQMDAKTGAASFARFFPVPGMNHCRGGPATDRFDALTAIVDWVEKGAAPESMPATASTPAYWNVAARSRPLCAFPKVPTYGGAGDIDDAANFSCR